MSLVAEHAASPNEIAASWLLNAMYTAQISVYELSNRTHIPKPTIYGVLRGKNKNACRFDTLYLLIQACGSQIQAPRRFKSF